MNAAFRAAIVLSCLIGAAGRTAVAAEADAAGRPAALPQSPALFDAVREGDVARLGALLASGLPVDCRNERGDTPLIRAAFHAGAACVELLLDRGADANARNLAGESALHFAVSDLRKVSLLLDRGGDPNAATAIGNTPLILASRIHGNEAVVRLLLDRGASPSATNAFGGAVTLAAAASGDPRLLRLVLDRGAPLDPAATPHIFGGWRTALMWAAFQGNIEMATLLLDRGVPATSAGYLGTALTSAAQNDQLAAARLLLERGASVSEREAGSGYTALHWAASTERASTELVELLLARGADPNAEGGENIDAFLGIPRTPLLLAQARGETAVVETLRRAGAKAPAAAEPAREQRRRTLPGPIDRARIEEAVAAALPLLQRTAIRSKQSFDLHRSQQNCVSCHQQYLPFAAVGRARAAGFAVDEDIFRRQSGMVRRDSSLVREILAQATFHPEPVYSIGYNAFALASAGQSADFDTDVFVHHLAAIQDGDGRWRMNLARPPIQTSDVGATALGILALRAYPLPGRREEMERRVLRARSWLEASRPEGNDERALRLLGLVWSGVPAPELEDDAAALIGEQREDGGWAQLPKLASDAYATAQAVYALRAAALPASSPAIERGIRFLLETRFEDGSWRAERRAFPFQPTMDSGFPHARDSWLSSSATSWAVLALLSVHGGAPSNVAAAASPPAPSAAEPPRAVTRPAQPRVDFATQVRPVLARSCAGCHRGDRPRGGFVVTSREALLAGGNHGVAPIVPGDSAKSRLLDYVRGVEEEMEMPPLGKRERFPGLDATEIAILGAWIDQGAEWPAGVELESGG